MKLLALMKKEFRRFFRDPRLICAILLPGIVIFAVYTIFGNVMDSANAETYQYKVYCKGESKATALIEAAVKERGSSVSWLEVSSVEEAKEAVTRGDASACLVFSEGFDSADGGTVELFYDLTKEESSSFATTFAAPVLQSYGMRYKLSTVDLAGEQEVGKKIMANILPFLIVAFIFSACMSVTLESVAGEKERGTLATILATPVKRSHIALGKILPLSCIASIGAASSFLGVIFSMPKLMGVSVVFSGGFLSYFLIFLLILSFVPLIVSSVAAVSTFSRSVKEASAYTSVIMILVMVFSLVTTLVGGIGDWIVAVPILNAVLALGGIISGQTMIWQALVSVGANLVYTVLLVFAITKMLSSERIIFGK